MKETRGSTRERERKKRKKESLWYHESAYLLWFFLLLIFFTCFWHFRFELLPCVDMCNGNRTNLKWTTTRRAPHWSPANTTWKCWVLSAKWRLVWSQVVRKLLQFWCAIIFPSLTIHFTYMCRFFLPLRCFYFIYFLNTWVNFCARVPLSCARWTRVTCLPPLK